MKKVDLISGKYNLISCRHCKGKVRGINVTFGLLFFSIKGKINK